jgi:3-oxoacyl-[acyl-carrier protein] reductase
MRFSDILVTITNKPCHHSTTPTSTAPAPSPKMNPPPAPIPRVPSPTGPTPSPRANLPQAPHPSVPSPSVNKPHRQQPSKSYYPLDLHKPFHPSNQHRATTQYATLLRQVVAAAFEAKLGAAFINAQKAVPMQQALENMGHPQPPTTTLKTNNSTAHGILTSIIKQK